MFIQEEGGNEMATQAYFKELDEESTMTNDLVLIGEL